MDFNVIIDAFKPGVSPIEIIIRGSIMYIAIFIMLRLVLKRQSSSVGTNDVLVLVLIADAAQNGMAGEYDSITDGIILVGTILFWSFFIDWLGYRFHRVERFIFPAPLLLVKDGRMLRRNMRKELVTSNELLMELREQGIDDISQVEKLHMEPNGTFSISLRKEKKGD